MSGIDGSERIVDANKKVKYQRTRTKHGSLNHNTTHPGLSICRGAPLVIMKLNEY